MSLSMPYTGTVCEGGHVLKCTCLAWPWCCTCTIKAPAPSNNTKHQYQAPSTSTNLEFIWVAVDVQWVVVIARKNPRRVLHSKPRQPAGAADQVAIVWPDDSAHIWFVGQQAVVAVRLLLHDLVEDVDERGHSRKVGVRVVPSHAAVMGVV